MNTSEPVAESPSPASLRHALGHFGTGVTIVTTLGRDGAPVGVTANSFNSVSLEPPVVLWSLRAASPSLDAFDSSGRFVVHVLTLAQVELSRRFASPVPDKFGGVHWVGGLHGLPLIQGCAAVFQCRTLQRQVIGDHVLYLGQVHALDHLPRPADAPCDTTQADPALQPLLYCHGRYARANPHQGITP